MSDLHRANAIFICSGPRGFPQEPGAIADPGQEGPGRGSEALAAAFFQRLLEIHSSALLDKVDGGSPESAAGELGADETRKFSCALDEKIQLGTGVPEKVAAGGVGLEHQLSQLCGIATAKGLDSCQHPPVLADDMFGAFAVFLIDLFAALEEFLEHLLMRHVQCEEEDDECT